MASCAPLFDTVSTESNPGTWVPKVEFLTYLLLYLLYICDSLLLRFSSWLSLHKLKKSTLPVIVRTQSVQVQNCFKMILVLQRLLIKVANSFQTCSGQQIKEY